MSFQLQAPKPSNVKFHTVIQVVGWLHILLHGLGAIVGVIVIVLCSLLAGGSAMIGLPEVVTAFLSSVGWFVGILLTLAGLPGFTVGVGLLKGKKWARPLGIVSGILSLLVFPIGTVLGVIIILALITPYAKDYFDPPSPPTMFIP